MKWVLSFIYFFCALSVFSAPWGAMADYEFTPAPPKERSLWRGEHSQTPGERYLLKKVLDGQPIRILLEEEEGEQKTWVALQNSVQKAYNDWFLHTAQEIRKAKREREFADILPLLEKGIPTEFVSYGEDISIEFIDRTEISRLCGGAFSACYVYGGREIPVIYIPNNPRGRSLTHLSAPSSGKIKFANLLHEIGHSLGFSDQYMFARDSNTHPVYRGANPDKTIMHQSYSLTCDDADGIINLIDLTRKTARGGAHGWRSLCKNSKVYYVKGSQFGLGPYKIDVNEEETAWNLQTFKDGVSGKTVPFTIDYNVSLSPFAPFPEKIIKQDGLGRTLEAQGPRGERVYYMHLYDTSVRLVTLDRKALLVEKTSHYTLKGKRATERFVFFGKNGRFAKIRALKSKSFGEVYYEEGEGREAVYLKIYFNKKGASDGLWSGCAVASPSFGKGNPPGIAGRVAKQAEQRYTLYQKDMLEDQISEWYQRVPLK